MEVVLTHVAQNEACKPNTKLFINTTEPGARVHYSLLTDTQRCAASQLRSRTLEKVQTTHDVEVQFLFEVLNLKRKQISSKNVDNFN